MSTKAIKDVFATLGQRPHETHPFVVHMRYTDGTTSQDINCVDLLSCRMVGNGMLSALAALNIPHETVNVVFDDRFTSTRGQ